MRNAVLALGTVILAGSASAQETPREFARMAPPVVREVALPLAVYTDEVLFGSVWERDELAPRDRSFVTVSALIAGGHRNQARSHTNRGLDRGISPEELGEIAAHLSAFTGAEKSIALLEAMKEVFQERGEDVAPLDAALASFPDESAAGGTDTARTAAIEGLWERPGLSARDRSLATVVGLIATTQADELPFYLSRAMDDGLTATEASEVITHLAFYTGWPNAMTAVPILKTVLDERAGAEPSQPSE